MFQKFILIPFINSLIEHKNRDSFVINNTHFSYAQLAQRIAVYLVFLNKNKETQIGLVVNDDIDTYAAIFAIWSSGKSYIPLNPISPVVRNKSIIDQVGLSIVIDSEKIELTESLNYDRSIDLIKNQILNVEFDQELAYIFFTSGSTGVPKGVNISKFNVANFIEAFNALGYEINEEDRCLQMFDLTFDLSVMSFLVPLLNGASVYTIPKNEIKYGYIFELMDEKELTVALMVPSILNYLRPYFDEIHCPKMKYSLFCGEALHLSVVEEWAKCIPNARIDNVYGPTENTIFCTCYTYDRVGSNEHYNGVLSIGKEMLNNTVLVFNDQNEVLNTNEIGELCLSGNQLTEGYFKNNRLNDELFFSKSIDGIERTFYRTGDLGLYTANGNINYSGRKDYQVKIQGFRIELSEIEFHARLAVSNELSLVALAIKNVAGNFEVALVLASEKINTEPLKKYIASKLPSYMVPTQYHFVKPFPLNNNGKIDRKQLLKTIKAEL